MPVLTFPYICRIWQEQPGQWFVLSTKCPTTNKWHDEWFENDEFFAVRSYVNKHIDKNIYVCPHGFTRPKLDKRYAVAPNLLWADLDEIDPEDLDLPPSFCVETSPGRFAALWLTDKPVTEELNRRLTYHIGADRSGWDYTQRLRLMVDTKNYKYKRVHTVSYIWRNNGVKYRLRDLERLLPKLEATGEGVYVAAPETWVGNINKLAARYRVWAKMQSRPTACDRSGLLWYLGKTVLEKDGTVPHAIAIVRHSAAFKLKYEFDWRAGEREIERLTRKFTAEQQKMRRSA